MLKVSSEWTHLTEAKLPGNSLAHIWLRISYYAAVSQDPTLLGAHSGSDLR